MNSENFENLPQTMPEAPQERKEEILDQAVKEAKERMIEEIRDAQSFSQDKFFKQMNIDSLDDSGLIGFHKVMKKYGNPFCEEVMQAAKDFYFKDNDLLEGKGVEEKADEIPWPDYGPNRPENEEEFLKEQISRYPNIFYRADMICDAGNEASARQELDIER